MTYVSGHHRNKKFAGRLCPRACRTLETGLLARDVGDGFVDEGEEGADGRFEAGDGGVFFCAMGEGAG